MSENTDSSLGKLLFCLDSAKRILWPEVRSRRRKKKKKKQEEKERGSLLPTHFPVGT